MILKDLWGVVIDESQAQAFSNQFFKGLDVNTLKIGGKLSPKILIVKPAARLSWQYHNRRAEIWQVYKGSAGIIRSNSDVENEMEVYSEGDQIVLKQGERHRLIGLDDYSVVAEILQVYKGSAGIIRSDSNVENEMEVYSAGDQIVLKQGERHRLIGLDDYSVVAEIWQHTDANNPSDEDDIIRMQDDFGR
jgi:mannose-6-phosphate isomerase-like protein (cupin superfamily)